MFTEQLFVQVTMPSARNGKKRVYPMFTVLDEFMWL